MPERLASNLRSMRVGVLLSLLTIVYGFGLGAAFGAAEDDIKGHLDAEAHAVLASVYGGEEAKLSKVTGKAWTYIKRAHLHANSLGTTALVMTVLLAFVPRPVRRRWFAGVCLGVGALGYSLFWMLAGLRAPGLGSTSAAKESLAWLAVPTSALLILGLLITILAFARFTLHRA